MQHLGMVLATIYLSLGNYSGLLAATGSEESSSGETCIVTSLDKNGSFVTSFFTTFLLFYSNKVSEKPIPPVSKRNADLPNIGALDSLVVVS
jgi:hypothetical protein